MTQPLNHSGFYYDREMRDIITDIFGPDMTRRYRHNLMKGYRRGQAFMAALPNVYYNQLTDSKADPFHYDTNLAIIEAIDYLTDPMNNDQERVDA